MSAARVGGAPNRKGAQTVGVVPRRAGTQRYWVIAKDAKDGFGQQALLTVDLEGTGEALAVFSFEEEAEMFLHLGGYDTGRWGARESWSGELVSLLYGPCIDAKGVALDPLPEMLKGGTVGLVEVGRGFFLRQLLARGGKRTAS